jgi:hypothetical protein
VALSHDLCEVPLDLFKLAALKGMRNTQVRYRSWRLCWVLSAHVVLILKLLLLCAFMYRLSHSV